HPADNVPVGRVGKGGVGEVPWSLGGVPQHAVLVAAAVVTAHPKGARIGLAEVDGDIEVDGPDAAVGVAPDDGDLPRLVAVRVEAGRLTVDERECGHRSPLAGWKSTRSGPRSTSAKASGLSPKLRRAPTRQ